MLAAAAEDRAPAAATWSVDFASVPEAISLAEAGSWGAGAPFDATSLASSLACRRGWGAVFGGAFLASKRASAEGAGTAGAGAASFLARACASRFWAITGAWGAEATSCPAGPGPPRNRTAAPPTTTTAAATPTQRQAEDHLQPLEATPATTSGAASLSGMAHQSTARQCSHAARWANSRSRSAPERLRSAKAASRSAGGCSPGTADANRCSTIFGSSVTAKFPLPRWRPRPSDRRTVWQAVFAPAGSEY
jgi:hypothetical protein